MKISIGILFLFFTSTGFAQNINVGANFTQSGRNVTADYEMQVKKHAFYFGFGYNINSHAQPDNQNNIYKKRLFATTALEHLNLNFGYQRSIFPNLKCIKTFLFYDLQAKYSPTRNDFPDQWIPLPSGELGYDDNIVTYGPFTWLENNIGIGFTADITDKFYLKQKFGAGVMFILGKDDRLVKQNFGWDLSTLLNFSVGMRL